jgi:D-alanyl-D-alanine dipeptidase
MGSYHRSVVLLTFLLVGCSSNVNEKKDTKESGDTGFSTKTSDFTTKTIEEIVLLPVIDSLEQILIDAGLVDLQSIDSTILVDLRYSSTNNFMHEDVYGGLNKAYIQLSVAQDLAKCQAKLKEINPDYTLLVYDAVRPRSVQQKMWDVLDMPINEKTKFVSNPKNGSIHNYGAAIDLTIATNNGDSLNMGAGFDDIRKIAYPRLESQFLKSGELTQVQVDNRKLLRKVMSAGGFYNIQTEWWHFNRYNRNKAKEMFEIVE